LPNYFLMYNFFNLELTWALWNGACRACSTQECSGHISQACSLRWQVGCFRAWFPTLDSHLKCVHHHWFTLQVKLTAPKECGTPTSWGQWFHQQSYSCFVASASGGVHFVILLMSPNWLLSHVPMHWQQKTIIFFEFH